MRREQRGTWSHSSPATGCVGLGNQPERLATSLAAPMLPWMSLMDDAEIWESGSNPDNTPCSSEHGASKQNNMEAFLNDAEKNFYFVNSSNTLIVLRTKYCYCVTLPEASSFSILYGSLLFYHRSDHPITALSVCKALCKIKVFPVTDEAAGIKWLN